MAELRIYNAGLDKMLMELMISTTVRFGDNTICYKQSMNSMKYRIVKAICSC